MSIDHVAKEVDDFGAHARSAGSERVGAENQDRPHDVFRQRWTDADGMTTHEIPLQRAEVVVRDAHSREVAESGVDAVHRIVGLSDLRDDPCGLLHLALRGAVEANRDIASGYRDDVGDGQVVAGEPEGGYFRFSRYQAPSSV
jgi:hypothetical protein